jgi:2,4-dienoyl-CoA reductase-like NADH-dependent reductase (Old Yellow Enzyme family)
MSSATAVAPRARLFTPYTLRGITLRNRTVVSPMCQYSCTDGLATDWHLVHLGSRAIGGAGLVIAEAAAVEARGRISPEDLGLWNDEQIPPLARVAAFLKEHGAVPGIQLAHAGRKASTYRPWADEQGAAPAEAGGWPGEVIAPSAIPFSAAYPRPRAMTRAELAGVREAFVAATGRALAAGFEFIELHAAHGYLLHTFLSPLGNDRTDEWGGDLAGRMRFPLEVVEAVRAAWPAALPLGVRISATDWVAGGWTIEDSVTLARELRARGVDVIDASSGGVSTAQQIPVGPGYQVGLAERIRREADIPTMAVGLITEPQQAEEILERGQADLIALARAFLPSPYWVAEAAAALGVEDVDWPAQYDRARPQAAHLAGQR